MQVLDYDALKAKGITYSKITLWRYIKQGRFPAPIKLGEIKSAWIESEIDDWIKARMDDRERAAAAEAKLSPLERERAKAAQQSRFKKGGLKRKQLDDATTGKGGSHG